ncbi:MAG: type 4a pilus biogenesis protein PilO [Patescibacteria group bacterium]
MAFVYQKNTKDSVIDEKNKLGFFRGLIVYRGSLVMVLISAVIMAAGYFLVISPSVAEIVTQTNSIDSLNVDIKNSEAQLIRLKNLEQEYNAVDQAKIDKVESLVTVSPDLPNLYIQIEELAKQNNLEVSSIKAEPKKIVDAKSGLGIVDVSIKINQGNYVALKKFLTAMENNLRIFDVQDLSFPEKIDTFTIELSAYYIQ